MDNTLPWWLLLGLTRKHAVVGSIARLEAQNASPLETVNEFRKNTIIY